ncbi:hypothetical protein KQI49_07495 [Virgibacillus sp. MSJ-26]|uniref:hypothetical protein n=1 Tax=Virgibacillus sp. MSJ-26 TaxID=2841522 RepID=UPI001C100346|nr:hypothetical protein [Virgibacillus sp. MSJ-26]MBU5466673.1 hypothetical protein [Virgibacillus sp. MSJ-26]
MAFGIKKEELSQWQNQVKNGNIAILTHYWMDARFPNCYSVTKVGCSNINKLIEWGSKYHLKANWIHRDKNYPHFDLFGEKQKEVLESEEMWDQIQRFNI